MAEILHEHELVRARRSKHRHNGDDVTRNPILDHTLQMDFDDIKTYARQYKSLDDEQKKIVDLYIAQDRTVDYYHGQYVGIYQAFVTAFSANLTEFAGSMRAILVAVSHKIVQIAPDGID